eukprot:Ihof_evm23s2 gene=Ihof_evmTU23s2
MKVTFKVANGQKITLDVESSLKVGLISIGQILRDDNLLSSYNIKENAVVAIVRTPVPPPSQSHAEPSPARQPSGRAGEMLTPDDDDMDIDDPAARAQILQMIQIALQNPDELLSQITQEYPEAASSAEFQAAAADLRAGNPEAMPRILALVGGEDERFMELLGEDGDDEDDDEDDHVFTEDELRLALSNVMTALSISPSPPTAPVSRETFAASFEMAFSAMTARFNSLRQYMQQEEEDMDQDGNDTNEHAGQDDVEMEDAANAKPAHIYVTAEHLK